MVVARMGVWGKGQQSIAPPQHTVAPSAISARLTEVREAVPRTLGEPFERATNYLTHTASSVMIELWN